MIRVGIVGAAGYVGGEMCRLLLLHPNVELAFAQSNSHFGEPLWAVHQDLFGESEICFSKEVDVTVDVLFLCSGHGKSLAFFTAHPVPDSTVVIDLGNDFRLHKDAKLGNRSFAYGLSDFFAADVLHCKNVANPGCFATAIQQGILPLAQQGVLVEDVHITAVTGSTGAGQSLSPTTHFSWRTNNLSTYKNFSHQHLSEIRESVERLQPTFSKELNFIPYRGDFPRGIIATIHTKTTLSEEQAVALYEACYATSPFTFVAHQPINLKQVVNTNKVLVQVEKHDGYLLITVVIDNLLRGAAGQAVENMNRIFGWELTSGLRLKPVAF